VATPRNGEDRLLRRLRVAAVIVILVMVAMLAIVDTFGRLFIEPGFHVSEVLFATLIGALLSFFGVEALVRLPKKEADD
jgi:hypothetical protein